MKKERTQLRVAFTKVSNELERYIGDESRPSNDVLIIKINMNKLKDKADRLFKLDDEIKRILYSDNSTTEEDLENEFESVESYRDIWSTVKTKYNFFIDHFQLQSRTRSKSGEYDSNVHTNLTYKPFSSAQITTYPV